VDDADEAAESPDLHLPHRQVHGEGGAVLASPLHLTADADDVPLAGLEIVGDELIVPVAVFRCRQQLDIAAHDLRHGIPEQAFGDRVEQLDAAAHIDPDHRIGDIVHDGADPRVGVPETHALGLLD
jgi:hypothetical protein